MTTYIALLRKDRRSDYGVSFPDLPGCVTAGESLEEARQLAGEVLRFHLRGMLADGDPIPSPSTLDQVMTRPENRDAVVLLVDAPAVVPALVRVNITLPRDVLERIDAQAKSARTTRSAFFVDAAMARIAGVRDRIRLPAQKRRSNRKTIRRTTRAAVRGHTD